MDIMDIAIAKALSGGGGGTGGGGVSYDLVLTEYYDEGTDTTTYTLTGMSFDEIEDAITQTNDVRRVKYIAVGEGTKLIQETNRSEYANDNHTEITYSFSANTDDKLIQMEKVGDVLIVTIFSDVFTATYNSTTKEYTLTPYTP